jgi:hypothetical protein
MSRPYKTISATRRDKTMLDDLRQAALAQDDDVHEHTTTVKVDDGKLFGMTALERMFVAIGLFGVSLIISIIMLIATDSIRLF